MNHTKLLQITPMTLSTTYNLTCDDLKLQIFNSNWTTLKKVALDLQKILDLFQIDDIQKLRAHGYLSRFKISPDTDGIRYMYDGKQFFTFVNSQTKTFVIDDAFNPVEVFSYKELKKAIDC